LTNFLTKEQKVAVVKTINNARKFYKSDVDENGHNLDDSLWAHISDLLQDLE
jgi:hypothetical protein